LDGKGGLEGRETLSLSPPITSKEYAQRVLVALVLVLGTSMDYMYMEKTRTAIGEMAHSSGELPPENYSGRGLYTTGLSSRSRIESHLLHAGADCSHATRARSTYCPRLIPSVSARVAASAHTSGLRIYSVFVIVTSLVGPAYISTGPVVSTVSLRGSRRSTKRRLREWRSMPWRLRR